MVIQEILQKLMNNKIIMSFIQYFVERIHLMPLIKIIKYMHGG